jgi:predicted nucleotidyltransferase
MENYEKRIEEVKDKIVKEFNPEKIILFGSWAWGNPTKDSDIDLLIVKNENKTRLEMMREVYNILYGTDEAIDALVYTPQHLDKRKMLGDPFILKILSAGKILYGTR